MENQHEAAREGMRIFTIIFTGNIFVFRSVLLVYIMLSGLFCYSQQLNIRNFSVDNGLPQSSVYSIFQDKKGFIWFGTQGGIAKYDGRDFASWSQREGLADNHVTTIGQDAEGNLWAGHRYDGVSCYHLDSWSTYFPKGLESGIISIYPKGESILALSEADGIFELQLTEDSIRLERHITLKELAVSKANRLKEIDGEFLLATDNGIVNLFNNHSISYFVGLEVLDFDKTLEFGMAAITTSGIYCEKNVEELLSNEGMVGAKNHEAICASKKGGFWLAGKNGATHVGENKIKHMDASNGIPSEDVSCIIEDTEGNTWFGLLGSGASQFIGDMFEAYGKNQGLRSESVSALTIDRQNRLWLAGNGTLELIEFQRGPGGAIKNTINLNQQLGEFGEILSIFQDTRSWMWLGTSNGAIVLDDNLKVIKELTTDQGLSHNGIISINEDLQGNIWLASLWKGVTVVTIKGHEFSCKALGKETGLPSDNFWTVLVDTKGKVFVGTDDAGIIVFDEDEIRIIDEKQGLLNLRAGSFSEDSKGNIWVGTIGGGIFRCNEDTCVGFTTSDGLSSDNPYLVLCDEQDNVWVGTNTGLDVLFSGELPVKHFDSQMGFLGVETNQNAKYKDEQGNLWFGTVKGGIKCNPEEIREDIIPPVTHITKLSLFLREEIDQHQSRFRYDENHLTFEFIGLHFTNPEAVSYTYMLEGFDSDWSPLSDRTYATYSFIPPGSYTFKIISQNHDGHQSKVVEHSFVIVNPFWATTWFYALTILAIITLILLLMRMRTIKIRRDRKKLEGEVKLRTQELEDERKKVVDQKDIIEAKNKKITDSIFYARTIQESVLPDEGILSAYFSGHFIYYQPRDIVSGDFYWFKTRGSKAVIVAADCTGHGVPGAFMSMLGCELLNQIVNDPEISSPSKMLERLDEGVFNALHRNTTGNSHDGMDIAICTFDTKSNVLTYSSASRPIIVQSKRGTTLHTATTCTVGSFKMQNVILNDHKIDLEKGDRVYLFTDGYTDQFGGDTEKKYSVKSFVRLIESLQNKTIENQKRAIMDEHLNWRTDEEQIDDILIMCLEV